MIESCCKEEGRKKRGVKKEERRKNVYNFSDAEDIFSDATDFYDEGRVTGRLTTRAAGVKAIAIPVSKVHTMKT